MSRLLAWLLRVIGPRFRIPPLAVEYMLRSGRIGKTDQIPVELVPLAARLWIRGWFNRQFLDVCRDWVLPYWAVRQLDPQAPAFVARALQPFVLNTAYRNWTAIGNAESKFEAIVDPRGLITPQPDESGWSLDAWLRVDDQFYFPSRLSDQEITQRLHEHLPLVQTQYEPARLRMNQEAFAVRDDDHDEWLMASYALENPRGEPRRASLYLAFRPFNPEGAAVIDHLELRPQNETNEVWINDALAAIVPAPNATACSSFHQGDVASHLDALNNLKTISDRTGLATFAASYEIELHPHSHRTFTVAIPLTKTRAGNARAAQWLQPDAFAPLKRDFSARWRRLLGQGMTIRVPDEDVQNAFDANKTHLLVLHDGDSITPGPFTYHSFWFRDAAYMLHALDQLGYHAQVKNVLKTFPRYLRKDGYVLAQDGEWDSNGEALWTIEQHTRLSGDYEILHEQYWQILNAAHWIDAARQKTKYAGERDPEYGLLPAGMSAEHLGPNDFYFWDDWWGLAGLRAAIFAAKTFNATDDAQKLQFAYDAFFRDVNDALARAAAKNHADWMPSSPYRRADSAMVSNLVASYPLQLVDADDPRIVATIAELKRVSFVDGAFFHHVGHGGFGTYLALHVAGSELFQYQAHAWNAFRFLARHASPTWTWGEAIHPLSGRGGHGDGHHGWAAADVISFIRNALLFEANDHLVITPAIPDEWVFETSTIKVERAATYFGDVDFTLAFGDKNATLVLKGKWREPPAYIEWNLPIPIKNAGGDLAGVEVLDAHRVRFPSSVTRVVATW